MCGTQYQSCRRGGTPFSAAPNAIFLFPGILRTRGIGKRRCVPRERRRNTGSGEKRKFSKSQRWPYRPTVGLWIQWPHLNTLGGSSPHLTMTDQRWLPIFGRRRVNGNVSPGFWGRRGDTPGPTGLSTMRMFRRHCCLAWRPG